MHGPQLDANPSPVHLLRNSGGCSRAEKRVENKIALICAKRDYFLDQPFWFLAVRKQDSALLADSTSGLYIQPEVSLILRQIIRCEYHLDARLLCIHVDARIDEIDQAR